MSSKKTASNQKVISLRDPVKGAVVQLLEDETMACLQTQEGLVKLINALAHYTEEGRSLFPEVFVFDHLKQILAVMPESEHVAIGEGPKTPETMTLALKKCAPLAGMGWSVYIERRENMFGYGLLRSGDNFLSLSVAEILVNSGLPELPVLMLHQVGPNVIEIRGVAQSSLLVNFGATRDGDASPVPMILAFIQTIVSDVAPEFREQALAFYRDVMMEVLHAGHGTLATAIPGKSKAIPKQFGDGIQLSPPIDVSEKIAALLSKGDGKSNMQLLSCGALIKGMLLSDGITVFGTDGSVRAYNVFVKHPASTSARKSAGGARHRTFEVLSNMVGTRLTSSFMLSQDGTVKFMKGGRDE